jgi:hypothetical protein
LESQCEQIKQDLTSKRVKGEGEGESGRGEGEGLKEKEKEKERREGEKSISCKVRTSMSHIRMDPSFVPPQSFPVLSCGRKQTNFTFGVGVIWYFSSPVITSLELSSFSSAIVC